MKRTSTSRITFSVFAFFAAFTFFLNNSTVHANSDNTDQYYDRVNDQDDQDGSDDDRYDTRYDRRSKNNRRSRYSRKDRRSKRRRHNVRRGRNYRRSRRTNRYNSRRYNTHRRIRRYDQYNVNQDRTRNTYQDQPRRRRRGRVDRYNRDDNSQGRFYGRGRRYTYRSTQTTRRSRRNRRMRRSRRQYRRYSRKNRRRYRRNRRNRNFKQGNKKHHVLSGALGVSAVLVGTVFANFANTLRYDYSFTGTLSGAYLGFEFNSSQGFLFSFQFMGRFAWGFQMGSSLSISPFVAIGVRALKAKIIDTHVGLGVNLGVHMKYTLTENIGVSFTLPFEFFAGASGGQAKISLLSISPTLGFEFSF